ncbi:hypothetical protein GCM10011316_36360 [Roseibium aquae]|uniref:Capsular polysaccharide synthesis protein n=1 Tax=Roseibium aquae TaxID=1323746 RepID=A0A916TN34_9HYPH|nr:hypothetical protein [Roseibium aquae]GGB61097.1 hypothetical protein GCM10011316_36360 [Roseibium aquae]
MEHNAVTHEETGALPARLFCFWTGDNPMSDDRKRCLDSLRNTGFEVNLVTPANLDGWLVAGHPLHRAYPHLSAVHRSDYLRAYFMHHHGGGYADIKMTRESWLPSLDRLSENPGALGIGYTEKSAKGVAHVHRHRLQGKPYLSDQPVSRLKAWITYRRLRLNWRSLIGSCAYILRPNTPLTSAWISTINARLDIAEPDLRESPADDPRAKREAGRNQADGYPLPWSFICADVFHPLVYEYRNQILHGLPTPSFKNYL